MGTRDARPSRPVDVIRLALFAAVGALGIGSIYLGLGGATLLSMLAFAVTVAVVTVSPSRRAERSVRPALGRPEATEIGLLLVVLGVVALFVRFALGVTDSGAAFPAWLCALAAVGLNRLLRYGRGYLVGTERAERCLGLLEAELASSEQAAPGTDDAADLRAERHLVRRAHDALARELDLLAAEQVGWDEVEVARRDAVELLRRMPRRGERERPVVRPVAVSVRRRG
ncbi:hypothetical protein [Desertihabitans aurantiacus]|uniref:hypothetical protein n=1 Tax=Desertihabitans aurantiacus TaxID=2282477 RepID=UPI000DF7AC22|nr:hypothetical protein [Desertihabitans aurantiacus]